MAIHDISRNNSQPDQVASTESDSVYSLKDILMTLTGFVLIALFKYQWVLCIGTLLAFSGFFAPLYKGRARKLIHTFRQQRSRPLRIVSAPPQGAGHLQRTQPRPTFIVSTPQSIAPSFPTAPSPSFSRISRSKSHLVPLESPSQSDKGIAGFGSFRLMRR